MATLICTRGIGVTSYTVHASYSVSPDPYPSGAIINSYSKTLENVSNNTTVTIYAARTTDDCIKFRDGYGFPVNIYTSSDGTNWDYVDYLQSSYVTFNSGSGTTYVRVGPATENSSTSYTITVDANGGKYEGSALIVSSSYPYLDLTDVSNNTTRSGYTLKGWLWQGTEYSTTATISKIASSGTIIAQWTESRVSITMIANGGIFQDNRESEKTFTKQIDSTLDLSTYSKLLEKREGYALLGWGKSANLAKPSYTTLRVITITSSTPTKFYAIWGREIYVKCSTGVQTIKMSNTYTPIQTSNNSFQKVILIAGNPTVTFTPIPFSGYEKPYTFIYQPGKGGQMTGSGTFNISKEYTYADNRDYITISATKHIDLFTWCGSDAADNSKIAKGQPVTNLTAESWNNLKDTLIRLSKVLNKTITIGNNVGKGSNITADEFNLVRTAIQTLSSTALLPVEVKQGAEIKASYFNGGGSLKSAVNWIINQYYNNG